MKTITIIDTFGFFFRSYFALPPLRNSAGFPTGLLTGFVNLVDSLRRDHSTDYLVFALDTKGKTFRNDIYPAYKANRDEAPEDLKKQLDAFTDPVKEDSSEENMLYELLLKSGYDLNTRIEKKPAYYVIDKDEMVVALSEINEETVKEIIELKPKKCIALDKLFAGNDQLKTNTVLQMKDAGIEFKTI